METLSEELEIFKPYLIQRAIERGIEQGIEQVAKRMIHRSYSDSEIRGLTGLDTDQIRKLRNKQ